MTSEERAKAVVAYSPVIPAPIRGQVETVITRAIKRALNQRLAELELPAEKEQNGHQAAGQARAG